MKKRWRHLRASTGILNGQNSNWSKKKCRCEVVAMRFLVLTFFFYKHIANLNAHLTELKEFQLKQMILNIRLKNQVKSSENFIEIYRDALLRYKERAETAEALVKRYNNATCKNDSLEKRISQMEEIQFKTIIQELTNDFD